MSFYAESFLEEKREQFLDSFRTIQALADGAWTTGEIQKREVEGDSLLINVAFGDLDEKACTITQVRVLDKNGNLVGSEAKNVYKTATQSTLFTYEFPIIEVES